MIDAESIWTPSEQGLCASPAILSQISVHHLENMYKPTVVTYDLILSRQELKFLYIYDFHFLQRLVICHLLIYKPWRSPRCLYACAGPHDTSLTRAARGPMRSNYLGQMLCPDLVFAQHLIPQILDNLQYPGVSIKVPSHLWSHGSSRTWLQHSPSQG